MNICVHVRACVCVFTWMCVCVCWEGVLLMQNLRLRDVKQLAQDHTVNHGRDLNSASQAPELMFFTTVLY